MARLRVARAGIAGAVLTGVAAGLAAVNRVAVARLTGGHEVEDGRLELPADCTERTVTVSDGWDLRVLERGPRDGRPVVLLHGITLSAAIWPHQLRALADAGLRVLAVDLRGHGASGDAGPGQADTGRAPRMGIARMAADVSEILDQLDLVDAVVVGHSMGGMVALRMMAEDPGLASGEGRVGALVLVATTSNATRRRGLPGLGQLVAASQPLLTSAAGLAARLPGPTLPANDLAFLVARVTFGDGSLPREVTLTGEMASRVPVRVSAELLLDIVRFEEDGILGGLDLPVTVVVGDRDLMTPQTQSEYLASHIPDAKLVVLPGCGHMVMLERPAELDAAILGLAR